MVAVWWPAEAGVSGSHGPRQRRLRASSFCVGVAAFVGFLGVRAEAAAAANLPQSGSARPVREATDSRALATVVSGPTDHSWTGAIAAGHTNDGLRDLRTAVNRDPGNYLGWLAMANATTGEARFDALRQAVLLAPLAPDLRAICKRVERTVRAGYGMGRSLGAGLSGSAAGVRYRGRRTEYLRA